MRLTPKKSVGTKTFGMTVGSGEGRERRQTAGERDGPLFNRLQKRDGRRTMDGNIGGQQGSRSGILARTPEWAVEARRHTAHGAKRWTPWKRVPCISSAAHHWLAVPGCQEQDGRASQVFQKQWALLLFGKDAFPVGAWRDGRFGWDHGVVVGLPSNRRHSTAPELPSSHPQASALQIVDVEIRFALPTCLTPVTPSEMIPGVFWEKEHPHAFWIVGP